MRLLKQLIPGYRLARQKREYELLLRAQGLSRKEALTAVAKKYPKDRAA